MKKYVYQLLSACVCMGSAMVTISCGSIIPDVKADYTGSIYEPLALPDIDVKAEAVHGRWVKPVKLNGYSYDLFVKKKVDLSAGESLKLSYNKDLKYLDYESVWQNVRGDTVWDVKWDHVKYGRGSKQVTYSGKPVYAIKKKDFHIGFIPKASD